MRGLEWLKQPIAHRGLHNADDGVVENSASAVEAAIRAGFAIEVDLQCAADYLPVVFHDRTLERLTAETGRVAGRSLAELREIGYRNSSDRILSLADLLTLVRGRTPLLLEIKSLCDSNQRFETNIAEALASYAGDVAVMSFDPYCVARFRKLAPALPRGLIAESFKDPRYWPLSDMQRFALRNLLASALARPHFIAYDIRALPAPAPAIARKVFRRPLLTWTVRSEADRERAERYADAIIFEGFVPEPNG